MSEDITEALSKEYGDLTTTLSNLSNGLGRKFEEIGNRIFAALSEAQERKAQMDAANPYPLGRTEDALECSQCDWKGYEDDAIEREDEVEGSQYWCPKCDELCAHLPIDELDIRPEEFKRERDKWISRTDHFIAENQRLESSLASLRAENEKLKAMEKATQTIQRPMTTQEMEKLK